MYDVYEELENACHRAAKELHDLNKKLSSDDANITKDDVDMMDKITHTIASTKKGMAMIDQYADTRSSGRDGSYNISGTYSNGMNRRYYDTGRRGSSRTHRDGDVMQKLTDMYHDARDDREADMIRDIMSELNR